MSHKPLRWWWEYQYPEWEGTKLHKEWRPKKLIPLLLFIEFLMWVFLHVPLVVLIIFFVIGYWIIVSVFQSLWVTLPEGYGYKVPAYGPGSDHELLRPKSQPPAPVTPRIIKENTMRDIVEIHDVADATREALRRQRKAEMQAAREYARTLRGR